MNEPSKKRRILWITPKLSDISKARADALRARGTDVVFFNSFEKLALDLEIQRASVVVVSDEAQEAETEKSPF